MQFDSPFSPLVLLLLYIYLPIVLHVISCQLHTNQKRCHLLSILRWHLFCSNIVVSYDPNPYELITTKEGGLYFILSGKGDCNFDVKFEHCRFVGFVNDVIDYGCLGCVFVLKLRRKRKTHSIWNFYSTIFLQSGWKIFCSHTSDLSISYWLWR